MNEDKIVSNRKIQYYGESICYSLHTPPIKRWEFIVFKIIHYCIQY